MARGINRYRAVFGHSIQRCAEKCKSFLSGFRQPVRIPVQNGKRSVKRFHKLRPIRAVLRQIGQAFGRCGQQVIKLIQFFIQTTDLRLRNPVILKPYRAAALQA